MKRSLIAATALLLGGGQFLAFPQATSKNEVFLLNNPQKNQWCSYRDEKRWRSDIDEYGALETASAVFEGGMVKTVKLTEADNPESGDWIAYDTYAFNSSGMVVSLHRVTNVLPGDVSRDELFTMAQRKLQRTKVTLTSLKTRHVVPPRKLWYPDRPVLSQESMLPFYALLQGNVSATEPSCISTK